MNKKKNASLPKLFLLGIAFVVTLIAIVSGSKLQTGHKVEVNSVSKERFKAPRDVENKVATERRKQEAYKSVLIVFNKDEEVEKRVYEKLDAFFAATDILRNDFVVLNNKLTALGTELEQLNNEETKNQESISKKNNEKKKIEEEIKILNDEKNFSVYLPDRLRQFLLNLSNENYSYLQEKTYEVLESVYELGIKDDDNFENSLVKIKNELSLAFADSTTENLAYAIITEILEPNLLADIEATEKAREQKMSEVEPTMFLKEQLIVDEGQVITNEIYETLNDLGLVQKDYEDIAMFVVGAFAMAATLILLIYIYLRTFPHKNYENPNDLAMLCTIYSLTIIFIWIFGVSLKDYQYIIPILVFTLLIAILFSSRLAIVMNICFATFAVAIANIDYNTYIYFIIAGIFISLNTKNLLEKRNKIIVSSLLVGIVNSGVVLGIFLLTGKTDYKEIIQTTVLIFVNGFLTVVIAMGTLPIWEALFGAETTIKLLELTNPDLELLARLTIEAPGTYHHSLIVANLAEAAAKEIGANAIWVRVGGYYHDIGKLINPTNYSENIIGENPHDSMDPYNSSKIIKRHVSYGLELAEKHKLPQIIKDMISMHHGNTLIKFFYNKALNDERYENIDEKDFRYEYDIPQYKEAGILMLADTVEAAVRSMLQNDSSMDKVEELIEKLVNDKISDGQLQDSMLTLKDIDLTMKAFLNVFKGMHHGRIAYPSSEDFDSFKKTASVIIENRSDNNIRSSDENIIDIAVYNTLKEEKLKFDIEVGVAIVSNEEMKELNDKHRNIDSETDVLSFPLIDPDKIQEEFKKEEKIYLGDIIIAIEKVKQQAEEYNHSFERELGFLVTHSMLHLLGYDHETEEDEKKMFHKQDKILDIAGIKR